MIKKSLLLLAILAISAEFSITHAQQKSEPLDPIARDMKLKSSLAQNQLDHRPYNPEIDPDINLYLGSWQNSISFNTHGNLVERAILTSWDGDEVKPVRNGQVLKAAKRFTRCSLEAMASTIPLTLKGEQEIFYVDSGAGTINSGKKSYDLRQGIFVLVPEGLEFTIKNTSDKELIMYLVVEPVPAGRGFRPNKDILTKDTKAMSLRDQGYLQVHWAHNGKNVFTPKDGLSTLEAVNIITFDPMVIGQPHSHGPGMEEVWTVVEGKNLAFLGKEIRWQYAGTGYKVPPTNYTPHSNINPTEEPCKFFFFAYWREHDIQK